MPTIVKVPTTRASNRTYDLLFDIYSAARVAIRVDQKVHFDFSDCKFLHQNAVAFLGALIRYLQYQKCAVSISSSEMESAVKANLLRNGFLNVFTGETLIESRNTIPFRHDPVRNDNAFLNYLREDWLGHGWVILSDRVKDAISTAVWEIYANGFEHSHSPVGIFVCGQYFPTKREIALSFVDLGIGIPASARTVSAAAALPDGDAIEWALARGNTSKPGNRGVGLDILRAFVALNGGSLEIVSLDGHVRISREGQKQLNRVNSFPGTILDLTLVADERRYAFQDEVQEPRPE